MNEYYGTTSSQPTERELAHRALARRAAAEGFVLLKNEGGALPLANRRIALYGMGARHTVKGGLGSGSVEERYSVTIEEGLKNAGYTIATEAWLDDYDREQVETYEEYRTMVESHLVGLTDPVKIVPLAHSFVYRYPSGRAITEDDVAASATDTAIYVLTRQAGECNDRKLEPGDYYLTDIERNHLATVAAAYAHAVLIINVGGQIDLGILDELPGIDAVVLFAQGGEEGGNALADVLSGAQSFSGKLADTIPLRYEDIPFGDEFSYLDGDVENENYREGIYVGYRYFDSFDVPVRFPFGFGLSYTTFDVNVIDVVFDSITLTVTARVENAGTAAGREVVQLYVSTPAGRLPKERRRLVGFAKTDDIACGGVAEVQIAVDLTDCASYDEEGARWLLEQGDYCFELGVSSQDTQPVAVVALDRDVTVTQCRNCCAPSDRFEPFIPSISRERENLPAELPRFAVDAASIRERVVDYAPQSVAETEEERAFLDAIGIDGQVELLRGGELQRVPEGALDIPGAGGKSSTALLGHGLRNIVLADGPAGVNICDETKVLPNGRFIATKVPERYNWGILKTSMAQRLAAMPQGTAVYRYATAWPVEMLLAQTWNPALVRTIGEAIGAEMRDFGITVWLGPALNIHRNPLGGRTFEYYSEDPFLSGVLAASMVEGVQSVSGCAVAIKHFCCNNSEDNRNGLSANVSERALREIYLKGFELCVRRAHPRTVMSSYNQVNHVYTANNGELLNDILRAEWGFDGLVMTDWSSTNDHAADPARCPGAGNDLMMPGAEFDTERVRAGLADGSVDPADVRRSAARVLHLVLNGVTNAVIGDGLRGLD